MKVFAAIEGVEYEGENVDGIYSTRKKAKARVEQLKKARTAPNQYERIDEYELDTP
jgi:hypothetical protein